MYRPALTRLLSLPLVASLLSTPALAFTIQDGEGETGGGEQSIAQGVEAAKEGFKALWDDPTGTIKEWAMGPGALIGGKILLFLVLFLVARVVAKIVSGMVRKALSAKRLKLSDLLKNFAINLTRNSILFLGVLFAMAAVGIPIGPFLAAFGVVGFVVGFALQDTMSNFASGVMILIYRPYDVGDVVTAGGETGKVDAMNLVSTTLITPDNQVKVVPNGAIWGGVITNVTANDTRRVDFVFGIDYGDDIEKAEKVLLDIVSSHDLIQSDPEPFIKLSELADSSVNFTVRVWAKTSDYWDVFFDITREVKLRFDKEGLSFPFPQQDVHMHQVQ
jgi:small conductance mechanosensitive channel